MEPLLVLNEATPTKNQTSDETTEAASPEDYLDTFKFEEGCAINPLSAFALGFYVVWYVCLFFWAFDKFVFAVIPSLSLVPFGVWWYANRFHCPLYDVISCYADGLTACFVATFFVNISDFCTAYLWPTFWVEFQLGYVRAIFVSCVSMAIIQEVLKCYTYSRNATHRRVKKAKRAMIVALIISLGFAFAETMSLVSMLFHMHSNLGWQGMSHFIVFIVCLGIPLHILNGYLSGLIYTSEPDSIYKVCFFTVPARIVYVTLIEKYIFDPNFIAYVCALFGSVGSLAFLFLTIGYYANNMPEISKKTYLSLLAYESETENGEDKIEIEVKEFSKKQEDKLNALIEPELFNIEIEGI